MFIPKGSVAFVKQGTIEFRTPRGAVLETASLATFDSQFGAATLDSGIFASEGNVDGVGVQVRVFNPDLTLVGYVTVSAGAVAGSVASSQDAFYKCRSFFNGTTYVCTLQQISAAAVEVQTWTLTNSLVRTFCVSWDGQRAYYSLGDHALHQYDLTGSTSSVFVSDPVLTSWGVVGLSDGTVASIWHGESPQFRVYAASGTLLKAAPFPYSGAAGLITRGRDDTSVWVWFYNEVSEIRVSDGAVLNTFGVSVTPIGYDDLFVVRRDWGTKLLSVAFDGGRNIQVDGSDEEYGAPHWEPPSGGA